MSVEPTSPRAPADAQIEPVPSGMRVTLRGISTVASDKAILQSIDLDVEPGSVVAIVGPSGGGKSTLLRTAALLEHVSAGSVEIDGRTIMSASTASSGSPLLGALWARDRQPYERSHFHTAPEPIRREMGVVFQDLELWEHRTVLENITEGPRLSRNCPPDKLVARARSWLDRLGMRELESRMPRTLSRGQAQRAAIARALVIPRRLVLLDEPTASLDIELSAALIEVIREVSRSGATIVLVTHLIEFARTIATRAVILVDGRVIEDGPAERVLTTPIHPRALRFIQCVRAVR